MKLIFLALFLTISSLMAIGQNADEPGPANGMHKLALEYFKIDFTKEQRTILDTLEIELIYSVDETGKPTLEKVNGVNDPAILDSLQKTTQQLPNFIPLIEDGIPKPYMYFLKISYPNIPSIDPYTLQAQQMYEEAIIDDIEHIIPSGNSLDMLIGGAVNTFAGNLAKHLDTGGGLVSNVSYMSKAGFGIGFVLNIYGNKLANKFPTTLTQRQESAPLSFVMGIGVAKAILPQTYPNLTLQADICAAGLKIIAPIDTSERWMPRGFSLGIVANYAFKIGKASATYYHRSPAIAQNYLNLHAAIRPFILSLKEASGIMFEAGVSYKLRRTHIDKYKFKLKLEIH